MNFRILTSFDDQQFQELKELMHVLTEHCELTVGDLRNAMNESELYVAEEGGCIIACATLCPYASPTGRKASVEDVAVLPAYQNQGVGRSLMEFVLKNASRRAPITLQLTSRPTRIAANAMYRNMGFEKKETNVYKLTIKEKPLED